MSREEIYSQLKQQLKKNGYKLTPQRRCIVNVLLDQQDKHLSSDDVYDIVKKTCPEIGLSTVYRTLQLFEKIGYINSLNLDDGCIRYEIKDCNAQHQHHHFICEQCHNVFEIKEDLLDDLEDQIEKKYGFQISNHNLKLYGTCPDCKEN